MSDLTRPWHPPGESPTNLLAELKEQMEELRKYTREVPKEYAGSPVGCSRLTRLLRREVGAELLRDLQPRCPGNDFRIMGIPVVEDEDIPDDEIRIRYRDGREVMFKLP